MQEFKGIFPYLISPVDENGNVKEEVLTRLVHHLIECGVHGLTPLGSTGEFFYLTWEQKKKIVETVVKAANHRVPVVAGGACSNTHEAIEQTKAFQEIGVDGILGVLNVYFPLQQNSIYEYYRDLAASTHLPVVIYNNPKIPAFVMQMGGVGWMSGPACLIPKESVRLYELCAAKKWDEAMVLQKKLWEINTIFQKYNLAACVKAGLELQGFEVGKPIPPTAGLSQEAVADIQNVLNRVTDVN